MTSNIPPSEIYDVSPKEREIIEWRAKRRLELRKEYQREIHNPSTTQEGYIFDKQVQRHYTVKFSYEKIFKPNVKNFLWFAGLTFGSFWFLCDRVTSYRGAREERFRTGQVSYKDREHKFV